MVRIAVVEDEELYTKQMLEYLERYQEERVLNIKITCFQDGEDIIDHYVAEYDIILLDIKMQFMDGMKAAEHIRAHDKDVVIIFVTNMTQYAIRGYEVDAMDYILKPVEYFSFSQKLDRALRTIKKRENRSLMLVVDDGVQKINISDLRYVESRKHYLVYHTFSAEFVSRGTMKELEKTLASHHFFRIGKGYLVNLYHVDGMKKGNCIIGEEMLPVSRARKNEFMEMLLRTMGE